MEKGGIHSSGLSHNALIFLADDTLLELYAFRKSSKLSRLRFFGRLGAKRQWKIKDSKKHLSRLAPNLYGKEGLMDFCLRTTNLKQTIKRLRGLKIKISDPVPFHRQRPDMIRMSWELGFPKIPTLPFIIGPLMPNILKQGEEYLHSNGATGIHSLSIAVQDLEAHIAMYRLLLEIEPARSPERDQPTATFRLDGHQIHLIEAANKKEVGIQEISLYTSEEAETHPLDELLLHGVKLFLIKKEDIEI